jgi:hypothetical protein
MFSLLSLLASLINAFTIPLANTGTLTIAVASTNSFRLSIDLLNTASGMAIPSPSIDQKNLVPAPSKPCSRNNMTGLCATFALHEDDGFSNDYATSDNVRVTSLIWDDANQLLKWNVIGGEKRYPNGNDYTEIRVALYEKDAKGVVRSGIVDINESGQIAMKEEGTLVHVGSTHNIFKF